MSFQRRGGAIRKRLQRTFNILLVLVALAGIVAGVGRVLSVRQFDSLSKVTQPLIDANAAYLQELTNAQTGERGYRLTRDPQFLEPYDNALPRLKVLEQRLRVSRVGGTELHRLVLEEIARAHEWLDGFAKPLVEQIMENPSADLRFDSGRGKALFDAFRESNAEVAELAVAQRSAVDKRIRDSARDFVVRAAAFLLLALGFGSWLIRRTSREVADPIDQMRSTVARLNSGDLGARTEVFGPVETQELALALNELAASREEHIAQQEDAIRRLEDLDRIRSDFVSTVSHELRTPLTSVTGYAEMLADGDGGELNERQAQMVDAIDRNARRLLALVEDLLTASRIEAGVLTMARSQVDLGSVIQDAVVAVRDSAARRELEIAVDIPPELGRIWGDAPNLERVMLNLLSNAVKFSPQRGRVTVTVSAAGERVAIEVSDTGMGVPEAEQPKLFEPFFRASTARDAVIPGTGLGLTIVKSIVEAHGGSITFRSVLGEGTTFRVELPAGRGGGTGQTGRR